MIQDIYKAVCARLCEIAAIKHIDWWNQNVEYAEQDTPWARPAVFVEFLPIEWERMKDGYRGKGGLRLHIVTDWAEGLEAGLGVVDSVVDSMNSWAGEPLFHLNAWTSSQPNHNHEEMVESIETWGLRVFRMDHTQET